MKYRLILPPSLLVGLVSIPLIWVSDHLGLWWMIIASGLCIGLFFSEMHVRLVLTGIVAMGGWGLDLLWQGRMVPVDAVADILAGILGLGVHGGYLVFALILLFAWLLCLLGSWVGIALRQVSLSVMPSRLLVGRQHTSTSGPMAKLNQESVPGPEGSSHHEIVAREV